MSMPENQKNDVGYILRPQVSVIVPVYNGEATIERCLDSLLKQEACNIEIIIVNDGSSDDSLRICESYAENNKNIKLISQTNSGLCAARNSGIKNSTGDYIGFVDCDDCVNGRVKVSQRAAQNVATLSLG
jgi:glycosyltransferase involved in cell wall biosynthesis